MNTLITQANLPSNESSVQRDPAIDILISRFVRSVIRLFSLLMVLSPTAAAMVLSAINCSLNTDAHQFSTSVTTNGTVSRNSLQNYRGVTITGVLSLVRAATLPIVIGGVTSAKETKKKNLNGFVLKCRRIFQVKFYFKKLYF